MYYYFKSLSDGMVKVSVKQGNEYRFIIIPEHIAVALMDFLKELYD